MNEVTLPAGTDLNKTEKEKPLMDAVDLVNSIQCKIANYTRMNGVFGNVFTEIWNLNAKFLSENPKLQNAFLKERERHKL